MKPGDRRHRPAIPDRWLAQIDVAIIPPADGIGRQVDGDFRVQIDDPFGMAPDIVANEAQGMLDTPDGRIRLPMRERRENEYRLPRSSGGPRQEAELNGIRAALQKWREEPRGL